MSTPTSRICILGGGFGGLYTALRLSQLPWEPNQTPEIVLVDRTDRFLFSPLLYELLADELSSWEIAPTYPEILADTAVRFQRATVTGIDLDARTVALDSYSPDDPERLDWDRLVLALGGKTPLDLADGAAEHAIPFRELADAQRLEERLRALEQSDAEVLRIAVVGGGYSGVELACKLADRLGKRGRIRLIERGDMLLKTSPDFNRAVARKALEARDVWIDLDTQVTAVGADTLAMDYKGRRDEIPVDIVLWTVGIQIESWLADLDLPHDARDRIEVEPTLQVRDRPDLFAIGDLASLTDASGQRVPATAQAALQAADYCAWNLWAGLTGRPILPFRYQHLGEMLVLGTNNAAISGPGVQLEGTLAYLSRRLVYLGRMPTLKHQFAVGANWMTQPVQELLT